MISPTQLHPHYGDDYEEFSYSRLNFSNYANGDGTTSTKTS